jgi:protein TonB
VAERRAIEKARAAAGALLLHALIGYALVSGFAVELGLVPGESLKTFDVSTPPPPPPPSIPDPIQAPEPEGAAAPPSEKARPIPVPTPRAEAGCRSWAVPMPGGGACAGSSENPGRGTGAGGEGSGAGAGSGGSGTGGGGIVRPPQRISGELRYSDYPGRDRPLRIQSVGVRFSVGTDGRATGCRVTRPSGDPRLDAHTCDLIEARFRYRPATDAAGAPVPSVVSSTFDWVPPALHRR